MSQTVRPTKDISAEQEEREDAVVARVLASFDGCADPRRRELMRGVVTHLHAFLRDVRLTEDEWSAAIAFLTAVGHMTDERRQEFILLSDTLGASMQTVAINNEAYGRATEATVFGPFFVDGSPEISSGGDIANGAAGEPCWVQGSVRNTSGEPVAGALIEVWEADADGFYDVQYGDKRTAARGHLFSGDRRLLPVLGDHADAVPHSDRWPGGADARSDGPLPDAARAPALHGPSGGLPDARHAHLRAGRRVAGLRRGVRCQRLAGTRLRSAAGGNADPGRTRRRGHLVQNGLRYRARPEQPARPPVTPGAQSRRT